MGPYIVTTWGLMRTTRIESQSYAYDSKIALMSRLCEWHDNHDVPVNCKIAKSAIETIKYFT